MPAERSSWNYIDARVPPVERTNDFLDTAMFGGYCKPGGADAASGQTASACSAVQLVAVCAGYGMQKITSGQRCTLNTKRGGSTSMLAKRHGTTHGYTPRDGARRCHTASPSQSTAQRMSPEDMCARASLHSSALDAPRRSCYIFCRKSGTSGGRT